MTEDKEKPKVVPGDNGDVGNVTMCLCLQGIPLFWPLQGAGAYWCLESPF